MLKYKNNYMNLKKFKITNKGLYWGLIVTFALLYLCVGFVSTLHSITFFGLANTLGLAVLLGITYEIGQASVLFSILMTKNKDRFLPWALMFLLTALQVTANVYASFKFMANSGSNDWQYWQKSILIGVQAENAEMYQVIISWIAGALLPIVALGMTALVANNIKMITEENEANKEEPKEENKPREEELKEENKPKETSDLSETIGKILDRDNHLEKLKNTLLSTAGPATKYEENPIIGEGGVEIIKDLTAELCLANHWKKLDSDEKFKYWEAAVIFDYHPAHFYLGAGPAFVSFTNEYYDTSIPGFPQWHSYSDYAIGFTGRIGYEIRLAQQFHLYWEIKYTNVTLEDGGEKLEVANFGTSIGLRLF